MIEDDIKARFKFHDDLKIMEVDFSDMTFSNGADVDMVYDLAEKLINETDKKWFFMVNYDNTRIEPDAWFQHARRGSSLNGSKSLGTVRFNPQEPTRKALLQRTKIDERFDLNLVSTREEAFVRIMEMKDDSR